MRGRVGLVMKKLAIWVMVLMLALSNTAFALELDNLFGGLTSMFAPNAEEANLPGEVVELENLNITLTNVFESEGNEFYTPAEGNEYMLIEFSIQNTGDEEMMLSTMLNFTAWCDGEISTLSLEALATGMLAGRIQLDCAVKAGESVTGIVGYEISKEWQEVIVEFSEEAIFGEKTSFVVAKEMKEE